MFNPEEDQYVLCFKMSFAKSLVDQVNPQHLLFKLQRNLIVTLDKEVRPFMADDQLEELNEWVRSTNHQIDIAEAMAQKPSQPH